MSLEVVTADALRLLFVCTRIPGNHSCACFGNGKQEFRIHWSEFRGTTETGQDKKTSLATTAVYFPSFACLCGNIILIRLHRLRIVRPLIRISSKKVGITREACVWSPDPKRHEQKLHPLHHLWKTQAIGRCWRQPSILSLETDGWENPYPVSTTIILCIRQPVQLEQLPPIKVR